MLWEHCVQDKIRDKLSPIVVEVGYSLVESDLSSSELQPVLDIYTPHPVVAQVSWETKWVDYATFY